MISDLFNEGIEWLDPTPRSLAAVQEIDRVLRLFLGDCVTFKVGDKVRYSEFSDRSWSELPGGTVLLFPSGDAHVLTEPGNVFLFRTGMITELADVSKTDRVFTVLFVPEPPVSERDELAFEIYKAGVTTTHPDAKHFRDRNSTDFWAFRAADYVLANFVRKPLHPALQDDDGDLWQWDESKEAYRCVDAPDAEPRSRVAIEAKFGPVKEVFNA